MIVKATVAEDWPSVEEALARFAKVAVSYPFVDGLDFERACTSIKDCIKAGDGYIIDGYLVMTTLLCPWYSTAKILQEWLVLKVYHTPPEGTKNIPEYLESLAARLGATRLITGDSSPVDIMGSTYRSAGFKPLTCSFFKEVKLNGIC
jgi:hypothetical protein